MDTIFSVQAAGRRRFNKKPCWQWVTLQYPHGDGESCHHCGHSYDEHKAHWVAVGSPA